MSESSFFNSSEKLVLVSYNLLGVDNASNHMDLYYNVPPKHLEWSRRKHLICKEISRYNASILCLQASPGFFMHWFIIRITFMCLEIHYVEELSLVSFISNYLRRKARYGWFAFSCSYFTAGG